MKKEILELLTVTADGNNKEFKILGFPAPGKMRIELAADNELGLEDATISRPGDLGDAKVGQTIVVMGSDPAALTFATKKDAKAEAAAKEDVRPEPKGNKRTPTSYAVSDRPQSSW